MTRGRKNLKIIASLITVYLLFFVMGQHGTSAWFVSETKARGYIENAKTEDILSITSEVISYDMGGTVTIQIDIVNKSEVDVPIDLEGYQSDLSPGKSFSEVFHKKVSSGMPEVHFQLKGFNHYINELISVPLKQKLIQENTTEIEKKDTGEKDLGLNDAGAESKVDDKPAAD